MRQLVTFNEYVIVQNFYLTVALGANAAVDLTVTGTIAPQNLVKATTETAAEGKTYYSYANGVYTKVANVTVDDTDVSAYFEKESANSDPDTYDFTAVKILVVTDDGGMATLDYAHLNNNDIKGANTEITYTTVRTVTAYIYIDGDEYCEWSNLIPKGPYEKIFKNDDNYVYIKGN